MSDTVWTKQDWQAEVTNGDTNLGFDEWKEHKAEEALPIADTSHVTKVGGQIAFLLESIAHLSDHPTIRANTVNILVAANIVRKATPKQLMDAITEVARG